MTIDRDDPILDACLDEVLAGKSPPDLTPQILRGWAAQNHSGAAAATHGIPVIPPHINEDSIPEPPPVMALSPWERVAATQPGEGIHVRHWDNRTKPRSQWNRTIVLAAGILGLGLAVGIIALIRFNQSQIARAPASPPVKTPEKSTAIAKSAASSAPIEQSSPIKPVEPVITPPLVQQSTPPTELAEPATILPETSIPPASTKSSSQSLAAAPPPRQYPAPSPDGQVVSFVNSELAHSWADAGVKPTPSITDAQWCR